MPFIRLYSVNYIHTVICLALFFAYLYLHAVFPQHIETNFYDPILRFAAHYIPIWYKPVLLFLLARHVYKSVAKPFYLARSPVEPSSKLVHPSTTTDSDDISVNKSSANKATSAMKSPIDSSTEFEQEVKPRYIYEFNRRLLDDAESILKKHTIENNLNRRFLPVPYGFVPNRTVKVSYFLKGSRKLLKLRLFSYFIDLEYASFFKSIFGWWYHVSQ